MVAAFANSASSAASSALASGMVSSSSAFASSTSRPRISVRTRRDMVSWAHVPGSFDRSIGGSGRRGSAMRRLRVVETTVTINNNKTFGADMRDSPHRAVSTE